MTIQCRAAVPVGALIKIHIIRILLFFGNVTQPCAIIIQHKALCDLIEHGPETVGIGMDIKRRYVP